MLDADFEKRRVLIAQPRGLTESETTNNACKACYSTVVNIFINLRIVKINGRT